MHSPLFMDTLYIAEVDVLKILGIYFDRKLTWSSMIDQLAAHCHQRSGAVFCARDYLSQSGLAIAFKSFIHSICEYSNIVFMIASVTHLHKLDSIQKLAEKLCGATFSSLSSCRNASFVSLLCKLLDLQYWDPLQSFCPALTSVHYAYSFCHLGMTIFCCKYKSLDLFINSCLRKIPSIWTGIPLRKSC